MDGQIDDQMDKKWTNEWNFERNLVDFELESGNKNVDGQTDVGHINLIGGLVTCNPPKIAALAARIPRQDGTSKQATKRCPKRWVSQAAIRLVIGQSVFKLESGTETLIDKQTDRITPILKGT